MKNSSLRLGCLLGLALPSVAAWGDATSSASAPLPSVIAGVTGLGTQTPQAHRGRCDTAPASQDPRNNPGSQPRRASMNPGSGK